MCYVSLPIPFHKLTPPLPLSPPPPSKGVLIVIVLPWHRLPILLRFTRLPLALEMLDAPLPLSKLTNTQQNCPCIDNRA